MLDFTNPVGQLLGYFLGSFGALFNALLAIILDFANITLPLE